MMYDEQIPKSYLSSYIAYLDSISKAHTNRVNN